MIWQYIIIGILITISAFYLYRTSKKKLTSPCTDCSGCPGAGTCSAFKNNQPDINKKQ